MLLRSLHDGLTLNWFRPNLLCVEEDESIGAEDQDLSLKLPVITTLAKLCY